MMPICEGGDKVFWLMFFFQHALAFRIFLFPWSLSRFVLQDPYWTWDWQILYWDSRFRHLFVMYCGIDVCFVSLFLATMCYGSWNCRFSLISHDGGWDCRFFVITYVVTWAMIDDGIWDVPFHLALLWYVVRDLPYGAPSRGAVSNTWRFPTQVYEYGGFDFFVPGDNNMIWYFDASVCMDASLVGGGWRYNMMRPGCVIQWYHLHARERWSRWQLGAAGLLWYMIGWSRSQPRCGQLLWCVFVLQSLRQPGAVRVWYPLFLLINL